MKKTYRDIATTVEVPKSTIWDRINNPKTPYPRKGHPNQPKGEFSDNWNAKVHGEEQTFKTPSGSDGKRTLCCFEPEKSTRVLQST